MRSSSRDCLLAAHDVMVIIPPAGVSREETGHRINVRVTLENASDAAGSVGISYSLLIDGVQLKLDMQTPPRIGVGAREKMDLNLPGVFSPSDYTTIWAGGKTLEARVTAEAPYRPPFRFIGRLNPKSGQLDVIESDWRR